MTPLDSTSPTGCPECLQRRRELDVALERVARLEGQVVGLEAQVKELLLQIQRNSSNSSTPPSANPPDAPKPLPKPPTGRRPGGQTGHRGHHRTRLPASRVNEIVAYIPSVCTACHSSLPSDRGPNDPEPAWHQVAEIPKLAAIVTEHQAHARTCPGCGAQPGRHPRRGPRPCLRAATGGDHELPQRPLPSRANARSRSSSRPSIRSRSRWGRSSPSSSRPAPP